MAHFKIFAHAKNFLIDLDDGAGPKLLGFYTGRCVEAKSKAHAEEIFRHELFDKLETNYNYRPSEYDSHEIIIEELEIIESFDDSFNIEKIFYEDEKETH